MSFKKPLIGLKSLACFLLLTFYSQTAFSQFSHNGYLRNYNAVLTSGNNEYLVGRNRFILNSGLPISGGRIFLSNEVLNTYTLSANDYTYDFAEGYVDLYFDTYDLRIGKQIITQGRTDGAFITDILSPIDLSEFLTQDIQDIKIGIPAFKLNRYFGSNYLEIVASPIYQSDLFDEPGERWFPFAQLENSANAVYADSTREVTKALMQGMIKWAVREPIKLDLDLLLMYWTGGSPAFKKDLTSVGSGLAQEPALLLTRRLNTTPILAYSGSYVFNQRLILKSESAFYTQKLMDYLPEGLQQTDIGSLSPTQQQQLSLLFAQNEDGFLLERPWLISMIGIETKIGGWTLASQFINEHIFNYRDDILQEQNFYYSTLLAQKSFMRDKLSVYAFGRYNYIGNDFWVNPRLSYQITDAFESTLGTHLFYGDDTERFYGHFSFQDYQSNSFAYLKLTAYF